MKISTVLPKVKATALFNYGVKQVSAAPDTTVTDPSTITFTSLSSSCSTGLF